MNQISTPIVTRTKKTVRFLEDDTVHLLEPHPKTDQSLLWTSEEDCAIAKKAQKQSLQMLRQKGVDRLIEDSFANPAQDVQKSLYEFTRHTEGRGLERQTCRKHYQERMHHRSLAIKAILLGQEQAYKQGLRLEDVSEQLRELSLQYCCTAKIFARRMGKADEFACYKKNKNKSNSSNSVASSESKKCDRHSSSKKKSTAARPKLSLVTVQQSCSSRQLQKALSSRTVVKV